MIRLLTLLLLLAGPAVALESAPAVSPRATATLVSDVDTVPEGAPYKVALRLRMTPGWHTYWRNPGDAGIAPALEFDRPVGDLQWPVPERTREGPLMTYGYTGEVMLAAVTQGPGPVKLHATWLVCANICVPEEADFRLDVPQGPRTASAQAGLFAAAQLPVVSPFAARIGPDAVLEVTGLSRASVADAWFLPLTWGMVEPSAKQELSWFDGGVRLHLKPGKEFRAGAGVSGVLVVRDPSGGEMALGVDAAAGPATAPAVGIWEILGLALLGGLILNLMPCVFPVLAMKAVSVAGLARQGRAHAWGQAASYTAGILACFAAVAFGLLALRQAGGVAGWGFQFQSPLFVAGLAWLLFAVGLNLSGVFAAGVAVGAGQGQAARGGHMGSFFTGLLAVLVATPCTAPFMSVAVAAGLAGSAWTTLAVFGAMGLGLALPFVVLCTVPAVARALPRPGRWMDVLKQALAFPMYAASAWLVWVMSQAVGPDGVLAVAAGLVLVGMAGWALGLAQSGVGRVSARLLAASAVTATLAIGLAMPVDRAPAQVTDAETFSVARLTALRGEGRPVFVNLTAAWCVTCLVNERIALAPQAVRSAFRAHDVAYLKGDWTRGDPEITAFLRAQGRDGVPLYMFYPKGGGDGIALPQLLTVGTVVDAIGG